MEVPTVEGISESIQVSTNIISCALFLSSHKFCRDAPTGVYTLKAQRYFVLKYSNKEHRQNVVYPLRGTVADSIREISSVARGNKTINCEFCFVSEPARAAAHAKTGGRRGHAVTGEGSNKKPRSVEYIGLRTLSDIARNEEMVCGDIAVGDMVPSKKIKK